MEKIFKKTILAVDDVPLNLRTLKGTLDEDYVVLLAKSTGIATGILENNKVDAILLDVEMPEMSGFDFFEYIKRRDLAPGVPVIFVTGHTDDEIRNKAEAAGAAGYSTKPYIREDLVDKIENALTRQEAVPA